METKKEKNFGNTVLQIKFSIPDILLTSGLKITSPLGGLVM
jgi:hypothetical protein